MPSLRSRPRLGRLSTAALVVTVLLGSASSQVAAHDPTPPPAPAPPTTPAQPRLDRSQPQKLNDAVIQSELEATGFIAQAGLMQPSNDVLFVFRAESEEAVRGRMAQDPWQKDGHARLGRVEEVQFRIGAPGN